MSNNLIFPHGCQYNDENDYVKDIPEIDVNEPCDDAYIDDYRDFDDLCDGINDIDNDVNFQNSIVKNNGEFDSIIKTSTPHRKYHDVVVAQFSLDIGDNN